mmetsp:Transcript_15659/g.52713  ORF Transcript_15659/g.52713 Transcript_15659/m.52713 type:complete len:286 (+) Transcript_15659:221-1078(+)
MRPLAPPGSGRPEFVSEVSSHMPDIRCESSEGRRGLLWSGVISFERRKCAATDGGAISMLRGKMDQALASSPVVAWVRSSPASAPSQSRGSPPSGVCVCVKTPPWCVCVCVCVCVFVCVCVCFMTHCACVRVSSRSCLESVDAPSAVREATRRGGAAAGTTASPHPTPPRTTGSSPGAQARPSPPPPPSTRAVRCRFVGGSTLRRAGGARDRPPPASRTRPALPIRPPPAREPTGSRSTPERSRASRCAFGTRWLRAPCLAPARCRGQSGSHLRCCQSTFCRYAR